MQDKVKTTLKHIEADLKDKGQRFTAPRQEVMGTLLRHGQAAKAYDILEMMGNDVKPMTVYRALDFLVAQGLVHRIESLNAYAPCVESHCDHKDSQYLICDKCENIEELHNHKIDHLIDDELKKQGFIPRIKTMEIHGICRTCS